MTTSARATRVHFDSDSMWVHLSDGRIIGVPLAWFPRLLRAAPEQREQVRISGHGLHWEGLDEDISIAGMLAVKVTRPRAARRSVLSRRARLRDQRSFGF